MSFVRLLTSRKLDKDKLLESNNSAVSLQFCRPTCRLLLLRLCDVLRELVIIDGVIKQ